MPSQSATDCTARQGQFVAPVAGNVADWTYSEANGTVRPVLLKEAIWRYALKLIEEMGDEKAAERLKCSAGKVRQYRYARDKDVPADVVSLLSGKTASEILKELAPYAAAQEADGGDLYRRPPESLTVARAVGEARGRGKTKRAEPAAPESRRKLREAGVVASGRSDESASPESEPSTPRGPGRRRKTHHEPKTSR